MDLHQIVMRPWDFTLYRTDKGSHVIKVVFSEGVHKTDVERFFAIDTALDPNYPLDDLMALSARIRAGYPAIHLRQLEKADLPASHMAKSRRVSEAVPIRHDQTGLKGRLAVLRTDMFVNDAGVPADLPPDIDRVVICDDTPNPTLSLRVHPVGDPDRVVYVDHADLALAPAQEHADDGQAEVDDGHR